MDYSFFARLSVLAVIIAAALAFVVVPLLKYLRRSAGWKRTKLLPGSLQVLTAGVYLALFALYLPYCRSAQLWGDPHLYLRPVLMALYQSLRTFVMGVSLDDYLQIVPADPSVLRAGFSLYSVVLYFAAPVLTLSNILSLFRNVTGAIYLRCFCFRRLFILSELNDRSLRLAESIAASADCRRARIVFCDVSQEEKTLRRLLLDKQIDAICLKQSVESLRLFPWGKQVSYLMIHDRDTRNTAAAAAVTAKQKTCRRMITIHVFSCDETTDYILDAMNPGNRLVSKHFSAAAAALPGEAIFLPGTKLDYGALTGNFFIRRLDPVDLVVRQVLTDDSYGPYRAIQSAADGTGTVSIAIVGMGSHGTRFLQTALWFYQRKGICVEVNVFDNGAGGEKRKQLGQKCPELVEINPSTAEGDACYRIEFYNTDCFSSDFDKMLQTDPLKKTNLVFINLGDDDADIRAAFALRTAFARIDGAAPHIYALVRDDEKARILNESIRTQKGGCLPPLRFVGASGDCYSYNTLQRAQQLEEEAFRHHLDWTAKENQLRHCYQDAVSNTPRKDLDRCRAFRQALDLERGDAPLTWGDGDFFPKNGDKPDYSKPMVMDALKKQVQRYMSESYCRESSLAKALHKQALAKLEGAPPCENSTCPVCSCERCTASRITEHMRWNAYMRALGYRRTDGKSDPHSKRHPDLRPWQELPLKERFKD